MSGMTKTHRAMKREMSMKRTILVLALTLAPLSALAAGTHGGGHDETFAIGVPARTEAGRVIEIAMRELDDGSMVFSPSSLEMTEGETVRLVVTNEGEMVHEFVMDTPAQIEEHKELMARFPEMEHDEPNALRLEPGAQGEIAWTFTQTGSFEFACLLPGHYDAGMAGPLTVN